MTFSALFLSAFPFTLGISLAFLVHPSALSLPQDCPVLLAFACSLTGCFVSLALLSGSPDFWAFLRGFLGHYRLSSTSSTAVHFYSLSCSPLGSFPRLSSSSTPFRVFFCLPRASRRLCTGSSFFSSVHLSFPLPLSLLLVWLLALGAFVLLLFRLFPTLFLAVPVEHLQIWLLFIFLSRRLISPLSLAVLFMAPRPLCLKSSLFVVAFPPVLPPWWYPSRFLCLGTRFSFPLSFFRLGVCARLWCLTLSCYLLALPRPLRWFSLRGFPVCSS